MKTPVKYFYFLPETIAHLEKNILIVSQEYVDSLLIVEFDTDSGGVAAEIAMLEELLMHVADKKEYYRNKQHQSYNRAALKSALCFLMILLVLAGLIYCFNTYYVSPKRSEMLALIEELKPYGITITQHSKRVYKSTEYWLEVSATEEYFPIEQYYKIKGMIDHICSLHSTVHGGKVKWILLILFGGAFLTVRMIYAYIKSWYKPQYKERYEKFSWLEATIEQRIADIKREFTITDHS